MTNARIDLSEDKKSITLALPGVELRLDAAAVDEFIAALGGARAAMSPEQPLTFAGGQKIACVPDPRYFTQPEIMQNDSLLHLRHPGFGWLSFMLPKAEAARLAGFLQAQSTQPIVTTDKIVN